MSIEEYTEDNENTGSENSNLQDSAAEEVVAGNADNVIAESPKEIPDEEDIIDEDPVFDDEDKAVSFNILSQNIQKALLDTEDRKSRRRPGRKGRDRETKSEEAKYSEWHEKVIQIRRVTKVVKGGKKLTFRAIVVVGNNKGKVGFGIGKSNEVIGAIQKAVIDARKQTIDVPIFKKTISYPISAKAGSGKIIIKPASEGTGIIAGGVARAILELCGVENVLCKSLGSDSPLNVGRATIKALGELRMFSDVAKMRGLTLKQMLQ